ncbi:MAG: FAD-dependent monooxygenase [Proteobacteria bacterium]|nr:FAD-dependent monooxygenase [Pseudomonadota bacterium]
MPQNFDIVIIGGSFAGMTAALALSNASPDSKIAIIEKQDILKSDRKRDGRAYAISSASLKLFKEIGIFDRLQAEAGIISDIKITDYKSPFFLDFLKREVGGDLGQIIENYHIHNALRDQILQRKNISVFAPNSACDVTLSLSKSDVDEACFDKLSMTRVILDNGERIYSKLLLACDGRFSKLRELYQIHTTVKKYHQTAIVFNIEHERSHQNIAHEKFLPGGPLAILPLKNPNQSSIVWISPDQTAQAIMALDEKNFSQQLAKKMEDFEGKILGETKVISEKFSYPLIAIEAEKFYHEKMLLIGDAACGVHPIAGQGFNLAISGINILCELVKNSDQNLIEAYNKKAKSEAKKMLVATDILNSLFETKSLSIGLARDFGLGLVNKLPRLKKFFIKSAGGF